MPALRRAAVRRALLALVLPAAAVPALVAPAGASAASSVTENACHYALDGYWRNLDVRFDGTVQPGPYVPPGAGFRLGGTTVGATLPDWISEYGFNLGHLNAGENRIPAEVWVAVAGRGSAQGAQVLTAKVEAATTITTDASGELFRGATPLQVAVPLADTTWTAPRDHGAPVTFEQAPPGSLPTIPGTSSRAAVTPKGSIFIRARLANGTIFDVDCQPGRYAQDGDAFRTGRAAPFALAYADDNAAPTGIAAPAVASPQATVRSAVLRMSGTRAALKLRNGGLIDATGQVRITTAGRHKVGRSRKVVTAVPWTSYEIGARKDRTVRLKLSAAIRRVLRTRRSVKVRVAVRADTGLRTAAGQRRFQKAQRVTLTLRRG